MQGVRGWTAFLGGNYSSFGCSLASRTPSVPENCLMYFLSFGTASEICTASVYYPASFGTPAVLSSVRTQVMRLYQPPPPSLLCSMCSIATVRHTPVVRAVITHVGPQPEHSLQFYPCLSLILQHRRFSLLHLRKAGGTLSGSHSLPMGPLLGQLLLPPSLSHSLEQSSSSAVHRPAPQRLHLGACWRCRSGPSPGLRSHGLHSQRVPGRSCAH